MAKSKKLTFEKKKHTFVRIWALFPKIPTFFVCQPRMPMDVFVSYGKPYRGRKLDEKK